MTESSGKFRISAAVAIQMIAWLCAALLTYGAVNARVAVLENRVDTLRDDVSEIKRDVKELLRQGR